MPILLTIRIIIEEYIMMHNPPHAGTILKDLYLDPLDLSITDAAKSLGITRAALSEIINGKRAITPRTAIKLAKAFGNSAVVWMNLQQQYDLWQQMQTYTPNDVQVLFNNHA